MPSRSSSVASRLVTRLNGAIDGLNVSVYSRSPSSSVSRSGRKLGARWPGASPSWPSPGVAIIGGCDSAPLRSGAVSVSPSYSIASGSAAPCEIASTASSGSHPARTRAARFVGARRRRERRAQDTPRPEPPPHPSSRHGSRAAAAVHAGARFPPCANAAISAPYAAADERDRGRSAGLCGYRFSGMSAHVILISVLGLSLLVIVHEAGHYLAARAFGIA